MTARSATRRALLDEVLRALMRADPDAAGSACGAARDAVSVAGSPGAHDPYIDALDAFALFMAARFDEAAIAADDALTRVDALDTIALTTARAARAIAQAGRPFEGGLEQSWAGTAPESTVSGDPLAEASAQGLLLDAAEFGEALSGDPLSAGSTDADLAHFARYLLAEAALASGRLMLAAEFIGRSGTAVERFLDGPSGAHPFGIVLHIVRVRVLVFTGRIDEARELLNRAPEPTTSLMQLLHDATELLVRGNAAERSAVRALADAVEADPVALRDYLSRGCSALAAFGLVAIGDVQRAARLAFLAGGDADLSHLTTIDRALGFELLIEAAANEGDLDAAVAWQARAEHLLDDPIAVSTVERIAARIRLLLGDAVSARAWAEQAVAHAVAEGRVVEAAEAEVLVSRARRAGAPGPGVARLSILVDDAERTGYRAARQAAVRELRASGRRLPPAAGSGWNGLSAREQDVAVIVAEGLTNAEIAARLHLSEHTVRAHVSRVLAAFGAASRFVVAARLAEILPQEHPDSPPPALTPRQHAVVHGIARGAGNAEIARQLGVTPKTVEKHVADIARRWGADSRIAIARQARTMSAPPIVEGDE